MNQNRNRVFHFSFSERCTGNLKPKTFLMGCKKETKANQSRLKEDNFLKKMLLHRAQSSSLNDQKTDRYLKLTEQHSLWTEVN